MDTNYHGFNDEGVGILIEDKSYKVPQKYFDIAYRAWELGQQGYTEADSWEIALVEERVL